MSPFFTRTLFAGASVALTLAMVTASAPASATALSSQYHQTSVQFSDLDLASPAGQKTLERRLNAAAELVCPVEDRFVDMQCRAVAVERARAEIARKTASSSIGAAN